MPQFKLPGSLEQLQVRQGAVQGVEQLVSPSGNDRLARSSQAVNCFCGSDPVEHFYASKSVQLAIFSSYYRKRLGFLRLTLI